MFLITNVRNCDTEPCIYQRLERLKVEKCCFALSWTDTLLQAPSFIAQQRNSTTTINVYVHLDTLALVLFAIIDLQSNFEHDQFAQKTFSAANWTPIKSLDILTDCSAAVKLCRRNCVRICP